MPVFKQRCLTRVAVSFELLYTKRLLGFHGMPACLGTALQAGSPVAVVVLLWPICGPLAMIDFIAYRCTTGCLYSAWPALWMNAGTAC